MTPEDLGRAQAITFTVADHASPSADGEHLALETYAPLEPGPSLKGTRAVFSRTAQGWMARSIVTPEDRARNSQLTTDSVWSPDLSQVAFELFTQLNHEEQISVPHRVEVGPVGGPYALVADIPTGPESSESNYQTWISGANAGTSGVPPFTDVLFESTDHRLLPPGAEATIAEETELGTPFARAYDLYEWTEGKLRLVNVEGERSHVKPLDSCGARLGDGEPTRVGANTLGAVSADGSKIFFTSCGRLYMRVDDRETVEVSKPQGVAPSPSERSEVFYNAATRDGSEVVFNTATPLLPGETASEGRLFMYDTVTGALTLIRSGFPGGGGTEGRILLLSEDGSTVYYNVNESIYRYEVRTGRTSFVATISGPHRGLEAFSYSTPNGRFLVFVSGPNNAVEATGLHGLEPEPRGAGHDELYRYDAASGSVMCVSCGEGVAPAEGAMVELTAPVLLVPQDEMPPFIQMSEDGQRVFFGTTARLVPQDTNSTEETGNVPGMDVYEWEADGFEEAPGVVCRVVNGCTHLISTGEDVGKATFLGASEDGRDVFFATAAQLVPQATPEFPNIYDARVGGGFAPPPAPRECLSCQGVGSPPPLFNTPASGTFAGPGDIAPFSSTTVVSHTSKNEKIVPRCVKSRKRDVARCARANTKGKGRKRAKRAKSRKGGKRS